MPLAIERNEIELTTPNGVSKGGVATFQLPRGLRFHHLRIEYTGVLADYPEIRVKANTETVRRYSFTEQDMMNQADKLPAAGDLGYLLVPFDKIHGRIRESEEETALNVGRPAGADPQPGEITNAEVQIEISGAMAVDPQLKIWATVSNAVPGGAGIVRHFVKTSRNAGGAGELDIQDLDYNRPNRAFIRRMFLATDKISRIKIKRDDRIIFDRSRAINNGVILEGGYRVQPAGYTLIDRSEYGYGGLRISTIGAQSFRLQLEFTEAAPSFGIITEYIGALVA
ncbi:major capsid protein P2 [Alloalcanivorax mobilis]|uniref:major capsid protein P2 n=1 Tax=Alloalcanivorax mobilis TaxID=2019569 RepID=UPI000C779EBF|nr:major capsid protein P2 [Alloalcanivorax mobilis]